MKEIEGNFDFLKGDVDKERRYLPLTLSDAYTLCAEYNFWAFFRECPPPSRHKYLWWHPRNINFTRWEPIYKIFDKHLVKKHHLDGFEFTYHMEILQFIANNGWKALKEALTNDDFHLSCVE